MYTEDDLCLALDIIDTFKSSDSITELKENINERIAEDFDLTFDF